MPQQRYDPIIIASMQLRLPPPLIHVLFTSSSDANPSRQQERSSSSSTGLSMFLGSDGGILGIGAPEVLVITVVGYFVLGPTDLYKLVKEIGKFITNIRTLGAEATAQFEGAMEEQLDLQEIRKAQNELQDAFSFRRSVNSNLDEPFAEGASEAVGGAAAAAATGVAADAGANKVAGSKRKKRRRVKKKKVEPEAVEDLDMNYAFEDEEETARILARAERRDRLEESGLADAFTGPTTPPVEEEENPFTTMREREEAEALAQAQQSRFQQQLSGTWNDQVLDKEEDLAPMEQIMKQLALLEEEHRSATSRIEEEFRKKEELEAEYYQKQRNILTTAANEVQQLAYATNEHDDDDDDDDKSADDNTGKAVNGTKAELGASDEGLKVV
eukprot:CAMPEP_0195513886 /NCGR_PEP_ID=MMETSP0794_2-20130614/5440_1 /TAXON_ID=515487 /ORGANISM="Stephanopyxis turris, Strain CCMP 815" /LENGTH=385 /DNA_ID=CAMNT_0040642007 /DNA_START=238 /DNA_END=1396 /DNA_ORIENTATION=-